MPSQTRPFCVSYPNSPRTSNVTARGVKRKLPDQPSTQTLERVIGDVSRSMQSNGLPIPCDNTDFRSSSDHDGTIQCAIPATSSNHLENTLVHQPSNHLPPEGEHCKSSSVADVAQRSFAHRCTSSDRTRFQHTAMSPRSRFKNEDVDENFKLMRGSSGISLNQALSSVVDDQSVDKQALEDLLPTRFDGLPFCENSSEHTSKNSEGKCSNSSIYEKHEGRRLSRIPVCSEKLLVQNVLRDKVLQDKKVDGDSNLRTNNEIWLDSSLPSAPRIELGQSPHLRAVTKRPRCVKLVAEQDQLDNDPAYKQSPPNVPREEPDTEHYRKSLALSSAHRNGTACQNARSPQEDLLPRVDTKSFCSQETAPPSPILPMASDDMNKRGGSGSAPRPSSGTASTVSPRDANLDEIGGVCVRNSHSVYHHQNGINSISVNCSLKQTSTGGECRESVDLNKQLVRTKHVEGEQEPLSCVANANRKGPAGGSDAENQDGRLLCGSKGDSSVRTDRLKTAREQTVGANAETIIDEHHHARQMGTHVDFTGAGVGYVQEDQISPRILTVSRNVSNVQNEARLDSEAEPSLNCPQSTSFDMGIPSVRKDSFGYSYLARSDKTSAPASIAFLNSCRNRDLPTGAVCQQRKLEAEHTLGGTSEEESLADKRIVSDYKESRKPSSEGKGLRLIHLSGVGEITGLRSSLYVNDTTINRNRVAAGEPSPPGQRNLNEGAVDFGHVGSHFSKDMEPEGNRELRETGKKQRHLRGANSVLKQEKGAQNDGASTVFAKKLNSEFQMLKDGSSKLDNLTDVTKNGKEGINEMVLCLAQGGRKAEEVGIIMDITSRLGGEIVSDFDLVKPECVVTWIGTDKQLNWGSSKIIRAARAACVPVVDIEWVLQSYWSGSWLDIARFASLIGGQAEKTPLFENVLVFLPGLTKTKIPVTNELVSALRAAGAKINEDDTFDAGNRDGITIRVRIVRILDEECIDHVGDAAQYRWLDQKEMNIHGCYLEANEEWAWESMASGRLLGVTAGGDGVVRNLEP